MFYANVHSLHNNVHQVEFGTTGRNGKLISRRNFHTALQAERAAEYYRATGDVTRAVQYGISLDNPILEGGIIRS